MFIGHHDEFSRDRGSRPFFSAATGSRIDYAYWTSGNPDNNGRDEHCVIMKNNDYRWNDVQCGLEYGYMCEEHHLTGKYKTNLEQKRQNVYQKNTKLSSDFLNTRNTIQNIITNAGTSTDSTFARHSKSTENIFNEFNESLYKILQKKPYMEVVLNEIREDLEQQELQTKQKLIVLSEQTSRELNEINTSAKTSSNNENAQFATKITQNTNEIHAILIF